MIDLFTVAVEVSAAMLAFTGGRATDADFELRYIDWPALRIETGLGPRKNFLAGIIPDQEIAVDLTVRGREYFEVR
jgi:hypothetical protein